MVPRVTIGHADDGRIDRRQLTARELRAGATGGAYVERDLIAAAAFFPGSTEDVTRHREQSGIVILAPSRRALPTLHRPSERRKRLRVLGEEHPNTRAASVNLSRIREMLASRAPDA